MKMKSAKKYTKPQDSGFAQVIGRKTAIWIACFILSGIATSLFTGMFDAWAVALKNASKGFLRKLADTYVIRAASTELTDDASGLALSASILLGSAFWMFVRFLEFAQKQTEQELADLKKHDAQMRDDDLKPLLHNLENQQKRRISELEEKSAKGKKDVKWFKWFCRIMLILMCYGLSLQAVSYALVKSYRQGVVKIRPFISDTEYYQLNRSWVMMKSRKDYRAIWRQIDEYEKRAAQSAASDLEAN